MLKMRPKACVKCRQWKTRCSLSEGSTEECSRCRSLKIPCVYDVSFKRNAKRSSVQRTPAATLQLPVGDISTTVPVDNAVPQELALPADWASLVSGSLSGKTPQSSSAANTETREDGIRVGNVQLSSAKASEYFRIYFVRCHPYLPFKLTSQSAEVVRERSPLLFWVICAVASHWSLHPELRGMIRVMVQETLYSAIHTVETVQALLLLGLWPSPMSALDEDPAYYLSGLAFQIALQLGLHRPSQLHTHLFEHKDRTADPEVKLTTWLACFVVHQMQAAARGLPPLSHIDVHFLKSLDNAAVHPSLAQLCRVCCLMMQCTSDICSTSTTPSGMLETEARLKMVEICNQRFATLQQQHLQHMSEPVEIMFLTARLQLWSFALLPDMFALPGLRESVHRAQRDAISLIDHCCDKNLSMVPHHVQRGMCYGAFALSNAIYSQQLGDCDAARHNIERVCLSLDAASRSPNDLFWKASKVLRELPDLEVTVVRPPILPRMGASIVYDSLKRYFENRKLPQSLVQPGNTDLGFDVDGVDWCSLGLRL